MKKISILIMAGALSLMPATRAQDAAVEEKLNKLNVQLEDLQTARVKLEKQMGELAREVSNLREQLSKPTGDFASAESLHKLAEKLQEIDQKRVTDNEKILKEFEKLGKASHGSRVEKPKDRPKTETPENPAGAGGSDKWFKHEIQSGDTISTIAQAYREKGIKVTSEQILKANPGLKPNSLKVGQEIYVPAP